MYHGCDASHKSAITSTRCVHGCGVKAASIAGAIFNHKNDKMGQQDSYRNHFQSRLGGHASSRTPAVSVTIVFVQGRRNSLQIHRSTSTFWKSSKCQKRSRDLIICNLTYGMLSAMLKQSLSWQCWQYAYALSVHPMQGLFVDLDQKL